MKTRRRPRSDPRAHAVAPPPDGPSGTPFARALLVHAGRGRSKGLAQILEGRGLAPLLVGTPDEARRALEWAVPDVALVGVTGREGLELLRALREAGARPVLMVTGSADPPEAQKRRAREAGAEDVLGALMEPALLADRLVAVARGEALGEAPAAEAAGAEYDGIPGGEELGLAPDVPDELPEPGDLDPLDPDAYVGGGGDDPDTREAMSPWEEVEDALDAPDTVAEPRRAEAKGPSTREVIAVGLGAGRRRWVSFAALGGAAATILLVVGLTGGPDATEEAGEEQEASAEATGAETEEAKAGEEAAAKTSAPESEAKEDPVPLPSSEQETTRLDFGEGVLAQREGRVVDAARKYRLVLRNEGYHEGALAGLASALVDEGQARDAAPILGRLVEVRGDDPEVLLQHGLVAAAGDDTKAARRFLRRFVDAAPRDPRIPDVRRLLHHLERGAR